MGEAPAPEMKIEPAGITFPATQLRDESAPEKATIDELRPGPAGPRRRQRGPRLRHPGRRLRAVPRTLAPGDACEVEVTFPRATRGPAPARSRCVERPWRDPGHPARGGGPARARPEPVPGTLDFGDQPQDTSGAPVRIVYTNSGTGDAEIARLTMNGTNAGDFRIVGGDCVPQGRVPVVVRPEGSCEVLVVFHPTDLGARDAELVLTGTVPAQPVTLTGNGVAAAGISFDPSVTEFGGQRVGTTSTPAVVTITNRGNATVDLTDAKTAPEFAISTDKCSGTALAPGDSCALAVVFEPRDIGARTSPLVVVDANGDRYEALLQGTGTGGVLTFDTGELDFGGLPTGSRDARNVIIRNSGNAVASISTASVSGEFLNTRWCDGVSLPPGGECTVQVIFAPTSGGAKTGVLTVRSNATAGDATLRLRGFGNTPALALSTTALDFGTQAVSVAGAQKLVTLTSSGTSAASVGTITITGPNAADFKLTQNCSTRWLDPGTTCTLGVAFTASATGPRTATVTIPSNAPGAPFTVTLRGTGS